MKTTKKISMIFMSLIVLSFTVLGNLEPIAIAKTKEYSGEELFKGIAFGVGGAQKEIPEIWPEEVVKEIDNDDVNERADMIVKEINKQDSQYFDKLKNTIYSKDHVALKKHLESVNPLLEKALKKVDEKYNNEKEDDVSTRAVGTLAVGPVVYVGAAFTTVAAATHVAVATAANVAAAANWVWAPDTKSRSINSEENEGNLSSDEFVNIVISGFN
ncbi:MAG: sporulation delaying protein family toxin [Tetragenococcus koreensis]|uniref:Sporulation delaying protein family toxin n=1 Tax=Staphylococcus equorum TaxID=246432 RepID=A0AAW7APP8_9STAP|nr:MULTISPECIES: sporulation delaying protein family toxin [Staphylococcus]MDN6184755.1 sporulation delaying protein family toxin [Lactococcus lactis]MDN6266984.1 sporulation delaying protein family toxin [Tetragenococcus koreensis]MDN6606566.1 sporulation delaying protein family toxin [Tetragenococcus halophilus]MDK9861389.1 sporulation delaying protein family toxin [Staphylococcus equorum]MDK9867105.1 sporulation delaying protein family toxin [Staphylococcus equorum]